MASDEKTQRYRAPALDKGLDILELLAAQPTSMTRGEIVKAMGRGPSEIYRMIERLVARGYVGRSLEGDRYSLTMKLFHLGAAHPPLRRLVARAQPFMDNFTGQAMQSVHLVVPDLGQAHVVAQASSTSAWEFRLRVGAMLDLATTGSGQTLLAFQSNDQAQSSSHTVLDENLEISSELSAELIKIKNKGYRIGPSQQLVGVTDITVPILKPNGDVNAVLTCPFLPLIETGPNGRPLMPLDDVLQILLTMAEQISSA